MKKLLSSLLALCLTLSLAAAPASALTLEQAKELLADHYVDEISQEILELDSLEAILEALGDPYTIYMTPEQYETFNQMVNGQMVVGIGATVEAAYTDGYRVMSVLPDSPALEAGLRAGDVLVAVDGRELTADTDPRAWIVGEEGTDLTVTVVREGKRLDFTLTRRAVVIPIVTYEERDGAGYINCISFGETTAETFGAAIKAMEDSAEVWIVDLRANPGGDSGATAATASLFTGGGVMLYFRNSSGRYNYTYTLPDYPDLTDMPVIILTSEHSASGAELFAGDIRAYGAGISLGQRTFGKGTAQLVLNGTNCPYMENGEALKVTAYRFFAPDGATNYITGVLPTLLISPENTERAAMLLSCAWSPSPENHLQLELAGQRFCVNVGEALEEENVSAFTELLEALPPSARLLYSTGQSWEECQPVSPAALAEELGLPFTPRTFSDAVDSPYAREIDTLAVYEIINGCEDGDFHPVETITRAQFCSLVASALDLPAGRPGKFADVPDSAWYAGAVNAMADMDFVSGGSDGLFGPEEAVSFQEMISILSRTAIWASMDGYEFGLQAVTEEELEEYAAYDDWAQTSARNLDKLGVLLEDADPVDSSTREMAAGMLCRLMERICLIWG
ncbi:PDZ domain-containing protein [Colidextribacter sp. OB.20]|uniref:S41 family peptidase n=1 Tax=Colidextribacter sp. OB.20 TaxID=2304568 RepID=UPI00136897A1|nr:S41 family peptidase [Colidextribacter sp. OB.20]NBI09030.1 PDZ domain-containing protein [Colidextribacter sp. OB.20]